MLPRRKSPIAASWAIQPGPLALQFRQRRVTHQHLRSGCLIHNQTTPRPASTPVTYIRVAHPRLLAGLGASRPLAEVSGEELAGLLEQLWGQRAPATWNRNRGAVTAWLSWCAANRLPAPVLPARAERRREHINATRGAPPGDRPGASPP